MPWGDIWKIVLSVIAGFGGISGLIVLVIKFSVNIIADNLSKKYELKLNEKLEEFKSQLDKKNYVSKTRFDTEFSVYKDLSKVFFEMVRNISWLIPIGISTALTNEEKQKQQEKEIYLKAHQSAITAQDTLNSNIPFIQEKHYEMYGEILKLCNKQLLVFENRWNASYLSEESKSLKDEDYERTDEIQRRHKELCIEIRNYLESLEII